MDDSEFKGTDLHEEAPPLNDKRNLTGQVVLVTGAERGIGRGIAIGLAAAGASILVDYLSDEEQASETARLCCEAGSTAVIEKGDVSLRETAARLINRAVSVFGRLDAVVNNAGIHIYEELKLVNESNWEKQMNTNVTGPFFIAQAAVQYWRDHRVAGRIVNITSCGSEMPFPHSAAYNASKGALLMLTRQLALELGPEGIRVNAVAPGVVHTSINDALLSKPEYQKAWCSVIPVRRMGVPSDLVNIVALLCSHECGYINGQQIAVDGGWSINPNWGTKVL